MAIFSLIFSTMVGGTALAHPAGFKHRHVKKVVPAGRRVVKPRRVVVKHVVHHHRDADAPTRVVASDDPHGELDQPLLGVGVRGIAGLESGTKIGLSNLENPAMAGAGVSFRTRVWDELGIELSVDVLGNEAEGFQQITVPIMASLTYHLLPESRIQPYALAGAGVHFTQLSNLGGQYTVDTTQAAAQLGAGVEVFLTNDVSINADVRGLAVFKNLDSQARIRQDCLSRMGDMQGFCSGIQQAGSDDIVNMSVQFQAGATYHF